MDDARRSLAEAMAEAATRWLDGLDDGQRAIATGATPTGDEGDAARRRWYYTPTDHGGLTVHQQRPAQQRDAMRLVASGLSTAGYVTVATIMGLENVLDHVEGFTVLFARERGRDPGLYHLRVFGQPGPQGAWGWRFGGHHVSLNVLVVDGTVASTTPCFLGADPASAPLLGDAVSRPLGRVEDIARELVASLPDALRAQAVLLDKAPPDLVAGNRTSPAPGDRAIPLKDPALWSDVPFPDPDAQAGLVALSDRIDAAAGFDESDHAAVELTPEPRGVPGAELDEGQREALRVLLGTYTGRVPEAVRPAIGDDDLDAIHLAWAGPLGAGEPCYYRLEGPRLLVEYDNTQRGADHAHSVWRDPQADFGADALAAHRAAHHGG